MRKICNRLLITMVLFGVLSAAAAHAQTISIGKAPADPSGRSTYDPPVSPTAGEPEVADHSPARNGLTGTRVSSRSALVWKSSSRTIQLSSADALHWALVIWMARYLNQIP
jgi:hypothetical protein